MKYINPVMNRNADDIENQTSKAYFNVVDWQRIYNNALFVRYIVEIIRQNTSVFTTIATPNMASIPSVDDLNTLIANINLIGGASELTDLNDLKANWKENNAYENPDYENANEWEQQLEYIRSMMIENAAQYMIYAGVGNAGQARFWQVRWRTFGFVQPSTAPVRLARTGIATCNTNLTINNGFRRYD